MIEIFNNIIKHIVGADRTGNPVSRINACRQFTPEKKDELSIAASLNAAFLISLSGTAHPLYNDAVNYLKHFEDKPQWLPIIQFYKNGLRLIEAEISERCSTDKGFRHTVTEVNSWLSGPDHEQDTHETVEMFQRVFFPEGLDIYENRGRKTAELREKRKISITKLNPLPICDPAREILFTSNILITVPDLSNGMHGLAVGPALKRELEHLAWEEQKYWYDHPVPVGVPPDQNEILYGLEGLDKAVAFEKERGTIGRDTKITCVLSVSVTHSGLQKLAKRYIEEELKKEKAIRHLNVYVITEADTDKMIEDILAPAAGKYLREKNCDLIRTIIGVDGEYGRHYSFLKAVAAFWQVFINDNIRGTFKIDLDQVFPQQELVEQSGLSAFEHLKTPLWGAEGTDSNGEKVELGMIAGALVNSEDIKESLFTPDVRFPHTDATADQLIFFSRLPQALSTEAEMMTRYSEMGHEWENACIQRIHVTGGTCGILTDSLRKYRPFTPTFIGRAEDQAYLLSVLLPDDKSRLRYVHKDGLIMRHDKEGFAGEAIKMAATGKLIGDYIRILMFSYYAQALPWPFEKIKNSIDPFTGCFASSIPLTVVYLRFSLKTAAFFASDDTEACRHGLVFMKTGARRLDDAIQHLTRKPNPLIAKFQEEKEGWDLFYDILDNVETCIKKGDTFALKLKEKAEALIEGCKINFEKE
jgi:hypothetical protein